MHLAEYIRARYPAQQAAIDQLNKKRRDDHRGLVEQLRADDMYLDYVAALSFADLVHIAGKDEAFKEHARRTSGRGWRWLSDGLAHFRNNIMHPARDVTSLPGFSVKKLADAELRITALTSAARAMLEGAERPPDGPAPA